MKEDIVVFLGRDGKIISSDTNPKKSLFKDTHKFGTHVEASYTNKAFSFKMPRDKDAEARQKISDWYAGQKVFGPFGDVLRFSRLSFGKDAVYCLNYFGQVAFKKPGLAADFALFLRDADKQVYAVGVIRTEEPGKGEIAWAGGFRDVKGCTFASAVDTAISEAGQEIGISLKLINAAKRDDGSRQDGDKLRVKVRFADRSVWQPTATLHFVGNFLTSDQEKIPGLNEKRVHETSAYALLLDVKEVSDDVMNQLFRAGDDAAGVIASHVSDTKFPILHHQEIFLAARQLLGI